MKSRGGISKGPSLFTLRLLTSLYCTLNSQRLFKRNAFFLADGRKTTNRRTTYPDTLHHRIYNVIWYRSWLCCYAVFEGWGRWEFYEEHEKVLSFGTGFYLWIVIAGVVDLRRCRTFYAWQTRKWLLSSFLKIGRLLASLEESIKLISTLITSSKIWLVFDPFEPSWNPPLCISQLRFPEFLTGYDIFEVTGRTAEDHSYLQSQSKYLAYYQNCSFIWKTFGMGLSYWFWIYRRYRFNSDKCSRFSKDGGGNSFFFSWFTRFRV